jgi:hypothetical protein
MRRDWSRNPLESLSHAATENILRKPYDINSFPPSP